MQTLSTLCHQGRTAKRSENWKVLQGVSENGIG